jgi:hypothetical protein
MPIIEKLDPSREALRYDSVLPRCKKSIKDIAEPKREKLRNDSDAPI